MSAAANHDGSFPHGLMFHRFAATAEAATKHQALSGAELEQVLVRVGVENILTPGEWLRRLADGSLESHHRCVTLDDGLRSQWEIALPVLDRLGLKAFWFVYSCVFQGQPVKAEIYRHLAAELGGVAALLTELRHRAPTLLAALESREFTDYAEHTRAVAPFYTHSDLEYRYLRNRTKGREEFELVMDNLVREFGCSDLASRLWLTEVELRALAASGHQIGLHSYDHPYAMAELTRPEQRRQYQRNLEHIAAVTRCAPRSMSHPLNSYNEDSLRILQELGIRCGFRANMLHPFSPSRALELPREDSVTLLSLVRGTPRSHATRG